MEKKITIVYETQDVLVCVKPIGVPSTEGENGIVECIRKAKDELTLELYLVHRLDQAVGGLLVLAKNKKMAAYLSQKIVLKQFQKEYLAVFEGAMDQKEGTLLDFLFHDAQKNKTYIVKRKRKGVREASLTYQIQQEKEDVSLVKIQLITGRTHQIRAQFSHQKHPLVGDRKYGSLHVDCPIALWSYHIQFDDVDVTFLPPKEYPWNQFKL